VCVCEQVQEVLQAKQGMCSERDERRDVVVLTRVGTCKGKVFANVSAGADTRANTASGGGAPQVGDLRLLEDGGERGGALVSDLVPP
jgi:hypothetical protein